jgi:hypothetical protein
MSSEIKIGGGTIFHSGHMNPLIVSAGSLVPKLQTVRFIVTLVATEALFQAT